METIFSGRVAAMTGLGRLPAHAGVAAEDAVNPPLLDDEMHRPGLPGPWRSHDPRDQAVHPEIQAKSAADRRLDQGASRTQGLA